MSNDRDRTRSPEYRVDIVNGKLVLPDAPPPDDREASCAWPTAVLARDPQHRIIGGERQGLDGPDGHVVLHRMDAPEIRFNPASKINTPMRLIEVLSWSRIRTDLAPHAYKANDTRVIAHVRGTVCHTTAVITAAQEAEACVTTFIAGADAVEGITTYGDSPQRFQAAQALQPLRDDPWQHLGQRRYLVDEMTGEMVIRVSDLRRPQGAIQA